MTPLFKKLNFKAQERILILNAPSSFQEEISEMSSITEIVQDIEKTSRVDFVLVFVTTQTEINETIDVIIKKIKGDCTLWYCYPKGSSKKYKCDFNRDSGWDKLGKYGLEGVRMVAIDHDWSALRFRHIDFIKKFTRNKSMALSKKGKEKGRS